MGVDANVLLTGDVSVLDLAHFIRSCDSSSKVNIEPTSVEKMVVLNFTWKGEQRHMYVHYDGSCSRDYQDIYPHEDGVLISVGCWGFSDVIMMTIVSHFGGFYRLNDCQDEWSKWSEKDNQPEPDLTWNERVSDAADEMGRDLTLEELLYLAKSHVMTPAEIEAQRESWSRQDKD